tara:strand:- start:5652 stop:6062 length:411 start_codon:yes stop_codon:yes gene_type:complete
MGMSDARSTGSVSGIGNTYDIAKKIEIDLGYTPRTARFIAHVSLVNIQCSSLAPADKPAEITIRISEDEEGDQMVLTDTVSTLDHGLSTETKATAIYRIDGIISLDRADTVYLHVKTDKGTLTVDQAVITYNDGKR